MNNGYNNGNINNNQYNNQNMGYNSMMNNQQQYNNQMMNNGYNNIPLNSNTNTLFNQQPVNNGQMYSGVQEPENITKGIIGAIGGSLLGSIVLIILYQIGVVAAISGLIMAALAAVGYEKIGGKMSRKGAIATIVVVLAVIFLAYNIAVTIELMRAFKEAGYNMPFFTVFTKIFTYLGNGYIDSGAYIGNLVLVYIFSIIGSVGLLKNN